jgi:sec-independent protein translocase protein TatA
MFRLGGMEWVIILLIVLLLFGPGRIGKIAGELGQGIKSFRDGLNTEKKNETGNATKDEAKPSDEPK